LRQGWLMVMVQLSVVSRALNCAGLSWAAWRYESVASMRLLPLRPATGPTLCACASATVTLNVFVGGGIGSPFCRAVSGERARWPGATRDASTAALSGWHCAFFRIGAVYVVVDRCALLQLRDHDFIAGDFLPELL
jgi:hypothetical protein